MKIFTRTIPEYVAKIALEISNDKITVTEEGYESAVTASRRLLAVVYFGVLFVGYVDVLFEQTFSIDIYIFVIVTSLTTLFALISLRKRINERTNSTEYDLNVEDEFFFAFITFQVGIIFLLLIMSFRALAEPIAAIIPTDSLIFPISVPIIEKLSFDTVIKTIYFIPFLFYMIEDSIMRDSIEQYKEETDSSEFSIISKMRSYLMIDDRFIQFKLVVIFLSGFNFSIIAKVLPRPYNEVWLITIVVFVPIGWILYNTVKPIYLSFIFIKKTVSKDKYEFIDENKNS